MKSAFHVKILIIVAAICALAYMMFNHFGPKPEEEKPIDQLPVEERLSLKKNIIVMGVDERPDDVGRSDTLFVVMFDTNTKSASLLSIPRDTRVRIKGLGWDKINHAYGYGGRELTQKTVEELLGIKINNYVMVDFKGFTGLVDAIGGLDIDVEKDMYYYDDWDGFKIDLQKGKQHMDGKTAIQYVRYRDEEGDIGRIKRQQHFLMAAYEKISSADMILHIPGLSKQLTSMVKTDLPISDMVDLGRVLHGMVREQGLSMATVPGEPRYIDEISYWVPDITDLREQMVKMQGATMTERYKTAAELMEREYNSAIEKVEEGDDSRENKEAIKKEKEQEKKKEEKVKPKQEDKAKPAKDTAKDKKSKAEKVKNEPKKAAVQENKQSQAEAKATSQKQSSGATVVRLVNCSGSKTAGQDAIARLRAAGFTVINGGSGELMAKTTVISTTNNGAVVNRLNNVPFAHNMRISRDGAADCDGVIMLGADFK